MSVVDKLVLKCKNDGVVAEQDEEIIRFGIDNMMNLMSCIGILICIGSIFGSWKDGLYFFLLFFPIRKYAGGYHSNTRKMCIVSSSIILFIVFSILYFKRWNIKIYLTIFCMFHLLISCIVPVQNQNKLLDVLEKRIYRRRAFAVLVCEDACFVLSYLINYFDIVIIITMVYVTVGILLIIGVIKNWYVLR